MVTQLQPDVRAYLHGGEVIKRYIKVEEMAYEYGFSVGVIVANMSVITDNLIDAFIKVAQVQAAGGIIVTVDDGRLAMQLRGF